MVLPSSGSITRTSSGQDSPSVMSRTSISEGETRTPPPLSRHSSQGSLKNAPWSRSSSQPGWRSEKRCKIFNILKLYDLLCHLKRENNYVLRGKCVKILNFRRRSWRPHLVISVRRRIPGVKISVSGEFLQMDKFSHPIMGFGSVPIASYENIAKLPDRSLKVRNITWNINEKAFFFIILKFSRNYFSPSKFSIISHSFYWTSKILRWEIWSRFLCRRYRQGPSESKNRLLIFFFRTFLLWNVSSECFFSKNQKFLEPFMKMPWKFSLQHCQITPSIIPFDIGVKCCWSTLEDSTSNLRSVEKSSKNHDEL